MTQCHTPGDLRPLIDVLRTLPAGALSRSLFLPCGGWWKQIACKNRRCPRTCHDSMQVDWTLAPSV